MLSTINCDDHGLTFIKDTEFSIVSSQSNSQMLHLFSKSLKNRCKFKTNYISCNKNNIKDGHLRISFDKKTNKEYDYNLKLFNLILSYFEKEIIVEKILEGKHETDQISLLYRYDDNNINIKLSDTVEKYLLGLAEDDVAISFLWKFNIEQEIAFLSPIKTETTIKVGLYLYEYFESIDGVVKIKEVYSDDEEVVLNTDFKMKIKI
jgi:hypothetical protein